MAAGQSTPTFTERDRNMSAINTVIAPPVRLDLPEGWRLRATRETVQYGDLSLETNPLRWLPVTRGGYPVNMGTYICRNEVGA